jgi:acyl carrier protein
LTDGCISRLRGKFPRFGEGHTGELETTMISSEVEIYDRLVVIFREALADPGLKVTPQSKMRDLKGWSSMTFIQVLVALEEAYQFEFEPNELDVIQTVEDLIQLIGKSRQ